jgi:hypothetical protein
MSEYNGTGQIRQSEYKGLNVEKSFSYAVHSDLDQCTIWTLSMFFYLGSAIVSCDLSVLLAR